MELCYLCKDYCKSASDEPCRHCCESSQFTPKNYFGVYATANPILLAKLLLVFREKETNISLYGVLEWLFNVPDEDTIELWRVDHNGEE